MMDFEFAEFQLHYPSFLYHGWFSPMPLLYLHAQCMTLVISRWEAKKKKILKAFDFKNSTIPNNNNNACAIYVLKYSHWISHGKEPDDTVQS